MKALWNIECMIWIQTQLCVYHVLSSHVHALDVGNSGKDAVAAVTRATAIGQEGTGRLPENLCLVHQRPQPIIQLSKTRHRE